MMKTMMSTAIVLGLLVSGGCARAASPEASPSAAGSPPPGTVWRWERLTGPGAIDVDRPGNYTIEFRTDGRYAVRADCNTGSGGYAAEGDSLTLQPAATTMKACPDGSLDRTFLAALAGVGRWTLEREQLVLHVADGRTLVFSASRPVELTGKWHVGGYNNGKQAVVSVKQGGALWIEFTDGRVAGSAGCNRFGGAYTSDGETISFGPSAVTRKMCAGDGIMEQEQAFLAALATVATSSVENGRLQLRTAAGALAIDAFPAVTGTIGYLQRIALPDDARIVVQVRDVSRADVAADVIGETTFRSGGKQVPIAFVVPYDPAAIDERHDYSIHVQIRSAAGDLLFVTTTSHRVITRDHPAEDVEVIVEPIR